MKHTTITDFLESKAVEIVAAYEAGESTSALGYRYDCNPGMIWLLLKSRGVAIRNSHRQHYGQGQAKLERIKSMFAAGMSAYAIADEIGLNKSSVLRLLKKQGVDTSAGSRQREVPLGRSKEEIIARYVAGESTVELADDFTCAPSSVWHLLVDNGVELRDRAIYSSDEAFFDRIDTEQKAYVLGWFYSDGNNLKNGHGIRLQITDRDILEEIRGVMAYTGPLLMAKRKRPAHHKQIHTLQINSTRLSASLTAAGCPAAKTFQIRFPTTEIVPIELQRHFVRGYLDGDGSIGCFGKARRWRIQIVGTWEMLSGLVEASGLNAGICVVQRYPDRRRDNWTLQIHAIPSMRAFLDWIYVDATIFLKRKHDKYLAFLATYA